MKALLAATALALGLAASPAAFADAKATCEKSAADKKLTGAAKDSHIKKCIEEARAATKATAKPPQRASVDASDCQRSASPVGCPTAPPKK